MYSNAFLGAALISVTPLKLFHNNVVTTIYNNDHAGCNEVKGKLSPSLGSSVHLLMISPTSTPGAYGEDLSN